MYRDLTDEALEKAAAPTLERIRQDRELIPVFKRLFTYLANRKRLLSPKLTAEAAWKASRVRGHDRTKVFRAFTGRSLHDYIERRKLEIADRLVMSTDVEIGFVSVTVGYTHHVTFLEAYKKWVEERPSDARRKPRPPEIDYLLWRRGVRSELELDGAWEFHQKWVGLYPGLDERLREHYGTARSGQYRSASTELTKAKEYCGQLDYSLGFHEIRWVEADVAWGTGDLAAACELYLTARTGFVDCNQSCSVGLICLDLAIAYAEQDRWDQVQGFASEAAPILGSLPLCEETLATVALLSQSVQAGEVSRLVLQEVKDSLQRDPLAQGAN